MAKRALIKIRDQYRQGRRADLRFWQQGRPGYGEMLLCQGFSGRVSHRGNGGLMPERRKKYVKDVSFILDIGGQDMKAMWLDGGIITNILGERSMFLRMRIFSGKLCFITEYSHSKDCRGCFFFSPSCGVGQPVYGVYEQQHHHGAAERKRTPGYHGRTLPVYYRKRFHQGGAPFQPGFPGGNGSWCRAELLRTMPC